MKRLKHFLLASCLLPGFLAAQGGANAYFLELAPDAQSAGMAGTGLAITDNGSTAIFHNASTIVFSQEVMITRCTAHLFSIKSEEKGIMVSQ